jgi:UPF0755 protein
MTKRLKDYCIIWRICEEIMARKKNRKRRSRSFLIIAAILLISVSLVVNNLYKKIYRPNVHITSNEDNILYIPTGSSFDDVVIILMKNDLIENELSFRWVAERMNYMNKVMPGRYRLTDRMNNRELITLLRSGIQEPVNVTFNNIRTSEQLAAVISKQIEADSSAITGLLRNNEFMESLGIPEGDPIVMFIPNTYQFYWNTSARSFLQRMAKEYHAFWSADRLELARQSGLTPYEVSTLASIVDKETNMNDEKARIAGVYMNRYKRGWKLEADPTLVFAAGDENINRVLNIHKEIDSPYNTYMYPGLPPGPICVPSMAGLKAVLEYEKHDFMFFCAKHDFSGYHSFAKTYGQHLVNARKFQNELNRRNIRS